MTDSIAKIIHTSAAAAAAIGGGLAQIPGSDAVPLTLLQVDMVRRIAKAHGHSISKNAAECIVMGAVAAAGGRTVSQFLVGWVPGWGNAINASTAASITEMVGWTADARFS